MGLLEREIYSGRQDTHLVTMRGRPRRRAAADREIDRLAQRTLPVRASLNLASSLPGYDDGAQPRCHRRS